jgi:D-alanine-D-alanine ligase
MGHEVQVLGVSDELHPIRRLVEGWQAQIVFNLLMEFQDVGAYQAHVASYLELLGVPFTGCNPLGILLARDKALCKKILRYHRIPTARFGVFPAGRKVRVRRDLRYPLIVKSVDEEASVGISQKSVVSDEQRLRERVEFIHRQVGSDAIAEEYIEGRELTVSVLGNERLTVFPIWELFFKNLPEGSLPIATARAKWDLAYQKRVGIDTGPARNLTPTVEARIARIARRVYRMLGLSGYARLDLRLGPDGRVVVIEANATPDIADDEDFSLSAQKGGIPYPKLLQRILNLGLSYRSSRKTA